MFKKPYLERGLKGEREIYVLPSGYRNLNTAIHSVPVKESKIARVVPSTRLYVPEVDSELRERAAHLRTRLYISVARKYALLTCAFRSTRIRMLIVRERNLRFSTSPLR